MKIAITADLHFQAKKLDDIKRGWGELIAHLINNKITNLLIGGDLFSNYNIAGREASFGTVYSALAEPLRKYKQAGGYVYAIPGNHDTAGQNQRDALVSLEELITVVRDPTGMALTQASEKIHIQFLPWLYNNALPHDQLIPKAKPGYFNVLLGHCEISGTQVNNHYTIPVGGHFELPKEAFTGKGYNYIAIGHIHKRIDWYVGAPWQTTFGEEGNKPGFVVLDINGGRAAEAWVDLKSPPQYHTYITDNTKPMPVNIKTTDYVKIKYAGEPPQIELGDNITLEKMPTQGKARTRTDVSTNASLKEMLAAWMKENINTLPAEISAEEILNAAATENLRPGNTTTPTGSIEYIESVRLDHIGSHTNTHINFDHKYIAISGDNGAGKTFLIDSIFATLFGKFPSRPGSIFDNITQGHDGAASMETVFRSHGKRYSALRRINNKRRHEAFLTDLTTNKIIAGPKVSDFDREIGVLVGSEDVVMASIFSAQKGVGDIVDADPSTRKEILGQILNIGFLVEISENAKQKGVTLKAGIDAGQRRINELNSKNPGQMIESERQTIGTLDTELNTLNRSLVSFTRDIKRITEEGQALKVALAKTEEARKSLSEVRADIVSLGNEMSSLQRQLSTTTDIVAEETSIVKKLEEIGVAKIEYQGLLESHEKNLKVAAKMATIDGEISVERTKIEQGKDLVENEIKTITREIKTEEAECEKLVKSYLSVLQIHTDKEKSLRDAGCSKNPLPCPFINDAIISRKKTDDIQTQIAQIKEASLKSCGDKELRIQALRMALEHGVYAKDAKARFIELQTERNKIILKPIPSERLGVLKRLVGSEGITLAELQKVQSGKESLVDLKTRYTETQKKASDKKSRELSLINEIDKNKELSEQYNKLKTLWENTSKSRDETQGRLTEVFASRATAAERMKQYEREIAELSSLNQNQTTDSRAYKVYETVSRAFGRNGIPQLLIDAALPQIQDILNNLLTRLDNKFTIRFGTQQETQTGKVKEVLDIIAGDAMGERDVGNFSGGEQKLLRSIIRIAIAVFQAQRSGGKYEILIIDEVFDALHHNNALKVLQILFSLQEQFKQIIVISHTDDLLFEFPVRINLQKTHKGSTYSLVAA